MLFFGSATASKLRCQSFNLYIYSACSHFIIFWNYLCMASYQPCIIITGSPAGPISNVSVEITLGSQPCQIWFESDEQSLLHNPSCRIARSAPWGINHNDVISGLQKIPRYLGNHSLHIKVIMDRYQELMLVLSESVVINRLQHPLAAKTRSHHIRLAIKPRYLVNIASQIKMYYGKLSESHGRSFRIHHVK